jgi:hypothetical protein
MRAYGHSHRSGVTDPTELTLAITLRMAAHGLVKVSDRSSTGGGEQGACQLFRPLAGEAGGEALPCLRLEARAAVEANLTAVLKRGRAIGTLKPVEKAKAQKRGATVSSGPLPKREVAWQWASSFFNTHLAFGPQIISIPP